MRIVLNPVSPPSAPVIGKLRSAIDFARVARFQAALDAKLTTPTRTWLDIAHSFGYYNQMHMVHDFESLGRNTPTNVLTQMGDVRPVALVTERERKRGRARPWRP
jgi:hypothetical protein